MGPQRENGFTAIANEIMEVLAKTKLNGTQRRILDVVFRYTYGYNRKSHELSDSFISKATDIGTRQINREIKVLIESNVIKVFYPGDRVRAREVGFNKHYKQWFKGTDEKYGTDELDSTDLLDSTPTDKLDSTPIIQEYNENTLKGSNLQLLKGGTDELDSTVELDRQQRKNIIKENNKEIIVLTKSEEEFINELNKIENYPLDRKKDLEFYQTLLKRYPELDLMESIKDWAIYKMGKPLKVKDNPRSQINTSFKKYVEWGKNKKGVNINGKSNGDNGKVDQYAGLELNLDDLF